ncbi:MAG: hypothetical protein H6923_06150 [Alphaproteobacteria bacterium]|nr:hypothetical protein [Alphaproteobacteria bacterium]
MSAAQAIAVVFVRLWALWALLGAFVGLVRLALDATAMGWDFSLYRAELFYRLAYACAGLFALGAARSLTGALARFPADGAGTALTSDGVVKAGMFLIGLFLVISHLPGVLTHVAYDGLAWASWGFDPAVLLDSEVVGGEALRRLAEDGLFILVGVVLMGRSAGGIAKG